jgi:hypothetical protein
VASVVVVDGVPETAEVLRHVFEPRGYSVERVRGFDLPHPPQPAGMVLVIHDDGGSHTQRHFRYGTVPRVVVGSFTAEAAPGLPGEQRLTQPFDYAELIRAVETLLASEPQRSAA